MARIAKGIPGINKIKKDNATGWHVWILLSGEENSQYHGFMNNSFDEIMRRTDATLTFVGGNVLMFNV